MEACPTDQAAPKCSNCGGQHPSYDRDCLKFWDRCRQINSKCPENKLAFYPTDEPWTWVTFEQATNDNAPNTAPRHNYNNFPTHPSGSNNTPLGHPL